MTNNSNSAKSQSLRLTSLALRAIGALAIVAGSFWITLKAVDNFSAPDQGQQQSEMRPTSWQTFGGASYQIQGDTVTMQGPGQIFNLLECTSVTSTVDFSIYVERAGIANMQLMFFDASRAPIGVPIIQTLNVTAPGTTKISGTSPPGTTSLRALIYSPQAGEAVAFKDPVVDCIPTE